MTNVIPIPEFPRTAETPERFPREGLLHAELRPGEGEPAILDYLEEQVRTIPETATPASKFNFLSQIILQPLARSAEGIPNAETGLYEEQQRRLDWLWRATEPDREAIIAETLVRAGKAVTPENVRAADTTLMSRLYGEFVEQNEAPTPRLRETTLTPRLYGEAPNEAPTPQLRRDTRAQEGGPADSPVAAPAGPRWAKRNILGKAAKGLKKALPSQEPRPIPYENFDSASWEERIRQWNQEAREQRAEWEANRIRPAAPVPLEVEPQNVSLEADNADRERTPDQQQDMAQRVEALANHMRDILANDPLRENSQLYAELYNTLERLLEDHPELASYAQFERESAPDTDYVENSEADEFEVPPYDNSWFDEIIAPEQADVLNPVAVPEPSIDVIPEAPMPDTPDTTTKTPEKKRLSRRTKIALAVGTVAVAAGAVYIARKRLPEGVREAANARLATAADKVHSAADSARVKAAQVSAVVPDRETVVQSTKKAGKKARKLYKQAKTSKAADKTKAVAVKAAAAAKAVKTRRA